MLFQWKTNWVSLPSLVPFLQENNKTLVTFRALPFTSLSLKTRLFLYSMTHLEKMLNSSQHIRICFSEDTMRQAWLTTMVNKTNEEHTCITRNPLTTASRHARRNWVAETNSQLRRGAEIQGFLGKSDNRTESELGLLRKMRLQLQPPAFVTGNTHRINFHSQFSKNIFITAASLKPQARLSRNILVCCVHALSNLFLLYI